jgi:hypothetical protein
MLISIKAKEAEKEVYVWQVLKDQPLIFFKLGTHNLICYYSLSMSSLPIPFLRDLGFNLGELRGSRRAENHKGKLIDLLGVEASALNSVSTFVHGNYINGCVLGCAGPIRYDPFIRSVEFPLNSKAFVDMKYHELVVPQNDIQHFSVEVFCKSTGISLFLSATIVMIFVIASIGYDRWFFIEFLLLI